MITRASLALAVSLLLTVLEAPLLVVLCFVITVDAVVYPEGW